MKIFICIIFAYLLGSLSPSALISKLKHKSLHEIGTGNLGATNTALTFGRHLGALVMVLDIFKGFLTVKIATLIVPEIEWLAMLAGFCAVIGHCFPFYLKFKGGKGLAAFGGIIFAYDPLLFLFVLSTGVILVLIVNSGTALAYYSALVFSIYVTITIKNIPTVLICITMSVFMMIVFIPNLKKAIIGQEVKSRNFLKRTNNKKS